MRAETQNKQYILTDKSKDLWLNNKKWDLLFISLSSGLIFFPIGSYYFFNALGFEPNDVSRNIVNGLVALLIGGPHMYATFTRTFLDQDFRHSMWWFLLLSLLIPILVLYLAITDFQFLITFFFFWASIHVLHQISYIVECYNKKQNLQISKLDRIIDYLVVFTSLYPIALYRFVILDNFSIGQNKILFPEFFKGHWEIVILGFVIFGISLILFIRKSMKEFKQGRLHFPKFLLMSLTVTIAFFLPAFPNLDVGFQGFNVWHSFQYLGLTWYINKLRIEKGQLNTPLIKKITLSRRGWKFYFLNVGFSVAAVGAIVLLLYFEDVFKPIFSSDAQVANAFAHGKILDAHNFYLDQCYYIVVLSFLLMHYLHDHLLFTKPEEVLR